MWHVGVFCGAESRCYNVSVMEEGVRLGSEGSNALMDVLPKHDDGGERRDVVDSAWGTRGPCTTVKNAIWLYIRLSTTPLPLQLVLRVCARGEAFKQGCTYEWVCKGRCVVRTPVGPYGSEV